jgi:hypothetical protein
MTLVCKTGALRISQRLFEIIYSSSLLFIFTSSVAVFSVRERGTKPAMCRTGTVVWVTKFNVAH